MTIYENLEAVPSRLLGLVRLLVMYPETGIARGELIALMQPQVQGSALAPATIDAAIDVGLVEEYSRKGQKFLRLANQIKIWTNQQALLSCHFPLIMEKLLLSPEIENHINHFAVVCAWLLAQPVTDVPQGHSDLKTVFEKQGFNLDELGLRNDARWDVLLYWVKYLGLAWQTSKEKCIGIIPDPTFFILRHLDHLIPLKREISVNEFRTSLGGLCPVLDGGLVRKSVLEVMVRSGAVSPWPDDQLSSALSFSIKRLNKSGHINYWCPDDQRTFCRTSGNEKVAFLVRRTEGG